MTTIRSMMPVATLVAVLLSMGGAHAQGSPGAGPGPGASAPGMGMGMGGGPRGGGPGAGRGMQAGAGNTPGWALMTPQERTEHQQKMASMTQQAECRTYVAEHHEKMVARAKEKGGKPLAGPRRDPCGALKP